MTRVYKAKYFPYDDILNSKKGSNPFYAWCSIHNSLEVIRKGIRWRVGNGWQIHIWDDKWLPTPTTYKVISPQSDFKDFLPFEANTILKIPLSYNLLDDSLIWIGNKRGKFTVKSAYHIAYGIVDSNEDGESSSGNLRSLLWKRIWHQKVSPKVKIFTWRTCVNGLPTMQSLNHRGIHCSSFCPLCDKAIETIAHVLLHCDYAKLTWASWHNCPVDLTSPSREPVDIALDLIEKGSSHCLKLFFAVAWSIWWNCNQANHKDSSFPPNQIWGMASRILVDYKEACSLPSMQLALPLTNWRAPPSSFFKTNVVVQPQMMAAPIALV